VDLSFELSDLCRRFNLKRVLRFKLGYLLN